MNDKLERLKALLKMMHVDAFILPMRDEFGSEYVPEHFRRIEYLCGFTGSNAFLVIGKDKSAFFTDGRYTLQAKLELQGQDFEIYDLSQMQPWKWINENIIEGKISYDPALFTEKTLGEFRKNLRNNCLVEIKENIVDLIWDDRPEFPSSKIFILDKKYAGKTVDDKIDQVIEEFSADYLIISDPENLCWLLNVRARDIEFTPVALCFGILSKYGYLKLYMNDRENIEALKVINRIKYIKPINDIYDDIKDLGEAKFQAVEGKDNLKLLNHIRKCGGEVLFKEDKILKLRALKNKSEQENIKIAHIKDGVSICRFLFEIEDKIRNNEVISEFDVGVMLEKIRSQNENFLHPSFATIAGFNENGAIVHYRADEKNCKLISKNGILLVDSGGQYLEGTTDITRTFAIGNVRDEVKRNFTLVLKGHIAVAMCKFPVGSNGAQIDGLARNALWAEGKDFKHGTGHGVGFCLNVHEGPHGISKINNVSLEVGMVVSNEPGYYAEGEYGIRIESLVLVEESKKYSGFLEFYTLTKAPIDLNLVDVSMLNQSEKDWLNEYHEDVYKCVNSYLNDNERNWLKVATRKI